MPRQVQVSEAAAARRRVYFHLVGTDGITPATGEAGGQPQIGTNGAAFTSTGIGVLTALGNGRYYADLTTLAVGTAGDWIETRYKSANTAECPGDNVEVVNFDPVSDFDVDVISPITADGTTLTLTQGSGYSSTKSRQIAWTVTSAIDLSAGTLACVIDDGRLSFTVTYHSNVSTSYVLWGEPTAAQTGTLPAASYDYQIWHTPASGDAYAIIQGTCNVTDDERS